MNNITIDQKVIMTYLHISGHEIAHFLWIKSNPPCIASRFYIETQCEEFGWDVLLHNMALTLQSSI